MANSCGMLGPAIVRPEFCGLPCYPRTGNWSQEEDSILLSHHKILGNKWTEISRALGGRTDNAVKNRFATLSKKQAKSKRKRSGDEQEMSSDECDRAAHKHRPTSSGGKRRGCRSRVTPLKYHDCQEEGSSQCMSQCQPNSHAQYAQLRAPHKLIPLNLSGLSPTVSSNSAATVKGPVMHESWMLSQPPYQSGQILRPRSTAAQTLPTSRFASGRLPPLTQRSHTYVKSESYEGGFKESTPPSQASTSEHVGAVTWEDDYLPMGCNSGMSLSTAAVASNADDRIAMACSEHLSTSPLKLKPSADHTDASWTDAALDGWLAANFTAEDMDALLPTLNALLPEAETSETTQRLGSKLALP